MTISVSWKPGFAYLDTMKVLRSFDEIEYDVRRVGSIVSLDASEGGFP